MRGDLDDKELRLLHVEALAPQSVPSWPAWLGPGSDHDPDLGRSELDFLRFAWSGAGSGQRWRHSSRIHRFGSIFEALLHRLDFVYELILRRKGVRAALGPADPTKHLHRLAGIDGSMHVE